MHIPFSVPEVAYLRSAKVKLCKPTREVTAAHPRPQLNKNPVFFML